MTKVLNSKTSFGLAILSGVLLLLSFPPFKFGGVLAWFAFVPILIAVYYEIKARRIKRLVQLTAIFLTPIFLWLFGLFANFAGTLIAWPLGVLLAFAIASYVVESIGENWKSKQLPCKSLQYLPSGWQIFILPILITAGEFLLMNLPVIMKLGGAVGFASVSRTQWLNIPVLQFASFTGMYGVTFLIWLVNSALAYGIIHYKETKRISKQVTAILIVFVIIFVCGWISIPKATTGDTTVAIIQAKPSIMEKDHVNELYANLSEDSLKYNPEIIFWSPWIKYNPLGKMQMVGPFADEYISFSQENDIYLTDGENIVFPDGNVDVAAFPYHFIHVFDGFVPFDLSKLLPDSHGFDARSGKFGLLGCMESASTIPTRRLIKDGVQFAAVVSGEPPIIGALPGLFQGHLAYRAVEHRIYTAFFYRDKSSIIVDPYGRIVEDIASEKEIVAGKISFTDKRTFYTRYGDIFSWTIVGLMLVLIGYNSYLKKRSPFKYCKKCRAQVNKDAEVCPECGKKIRKKCG